MILVLVRFFFFFSLFIYFLVNRASFGQTKNEEKEEEKDGLN